MTPDELLAQVLANLEEKGHHDAAQYLRAMARLAGAAAALRMAGAS